MITALLLLAAGDPPPTPASHKTEAELAVAFTQRLQVGAGVKPLTFDLFTPDLDAAFTSSDGKSAVLWLALRDDTGRLLATEPGLALARRVDAAWQMLLPGDPGWDESLSGLPGGMLPLELNRRQIPQRRGPQQQVRRLPAITCPTLPAPLAGWKTRHPRPGVITLFEDDDPVFAVLRA